MDEIYTIMQRLALIEGSITPTNVKQGLNSQQKSVPQMPALYKMPSQGPVLGGDPDREQGVTEGRFIEPKQEKPPKSTAAVTLKQLLKNKKENPGQSPFKTQDDKVKKYLSVDEEAMLEEVTSEDKLDKVKKSFADYLNSIADEKKDTDLKEKVKQDSDIKEKDTKDASIIAKQITGVAESPTEEDPIVQMPTPPVENPVYAESAPVKTIALEDGRACEIHGDEHRGFEIRHNGRSMKSRFKNLDQAQMALEMYVARNKQQDESADYIEEA